MRTISNASTRFAIEACKQSGRNRLMQIRKPISLDELLASEIAQSRWVLHPNHDQHPILSITEATRSQTRWVSRRWFSVSAPKEVSPTWRSIRSSTRSNTPHARRSHPEGGDSGLHGRNARGAVAANIERNCVKLGKGIANSESTLRSASPRQLGSARRIRRRLRGLSYLASGSQML